jgi:hypothetical protein
MVKITWLGEGDGPKENRWNGIVFPVGQAVEVEDEHMIRKAKGNRFYKVEETTKEAKHVEAKSEEAKEEPQQEEPPWIEAVPVSPHKDESYKPARRARKKAARGLYGPHSTDT